MILYHGSNIAVTEPQIIVSNRALDFGAGFYTTSSEEQAIRWAKLQALRRGKGISALRFAFSVCRWRMAPVCDR